MVCFDWIEAQFWLSSDWMCHDIDMMSIEFLLDVGFGFELTIDVCY